MLGRILFAVVGVLAGGAAVHLAPAYFWPPPPAARLPTTKPEELQALRPGFVQGYLPRASLVDSLALLPPPPAAGSPEQAADEAVRLAVLPLRDTPRWKLAAHDAELTFPKAAETFACSLGITISPEATPHLNMLLRRTLADAGLATYKAKDKYTRPRPFVAVNDNTICVPKDEASLRKDGSYPSGHAALGWAWALVLMELAPDRADAIAQRGHAYGQSRVVCGVHWQSDVEAGRHVGAAAVAQLHANADFIAQLSAARKEVAAARAAGSKPSADCALEQQALAR